MNGVLIKTEFIVQYDYKVPAQLAGRVAGVWSPSGKDTYHVATMFLIWVRLGIFYLKKILFLRCNLEHTTLIYHDINILSFIFMNIGDLLSKNLNLFTLKHFDARGLHF